MLALPFTDSIAGNEQQLGNTSQSRGERLRRIIVEEAQPGAERGKIGSLPQITNQRDDRDICVALAQHPHDDLSEPSGSPRNGNRPSLSRHICLFSDTLFAAVSRTNRLPSAAKSFRTD